MFKATYGVTFLTRKMTPKALHKAKASAQATAAVMLFDENVVRAMLALTGPAVDSEEAAAAVFSQIARGRRGTEEAILRGEAFMTSDWAGAQMWARRWLPKVAVFDRLSASARASFLARFNELLPISGIKVKLGVRGFMVIPAGDRDSIGEACLRAFVPFLIPKGWNPRRLGQCQYEECGQWFLRPEPKRGSVPLYCSRKHANLARVRAFREKHKQFVFANQTAAKHK